MGRLKNGLMVGIGLVALVSGLVVVLKQQGLHAQDDFTYKGEIDAPEFPEGLTWLNVETPLRIADLKGKIVLLDFWTYGCINCIHIIPELKRLEAQYPNELVVIGVHSAKFDNEGVTENIRQIVQRYGVQHPIVNDADFVIWQNYSVRAWPSLYLIDPTGKVVGRHEGEGVYEVIAPVLSTMVEEYGAAGLLDETPLPLAPEIAKMTDTPLSFPGKVLADEAGNRLFIADSGHNRIVVARLDNFEVQQVIGSGEAGLVDGDFQTASFNTPQGMALVDNTLYVADTNNHAIRAVDLDAGTVTRIAGTGQKAEFSLREGPADSLSLRSPWDLTFYDGILYIAMAGSHQLWSLNLETGELALFAGNGAEELIDAARKDAELAQPSGVATDGTYVYFADSESSSIRRAAIAEEGQVETIVGPVNEPQGRLFAFGDVDGEFDQVRLQHPLGVTLDDSGLLYIADTYNNKIKVIDPDAKTSTTFAGSATGGYFDGSGEEALFDEPGGLDYSNGKLYVADTNNHAIRIVDTATQAVSTLIFPNVTVLLPQTTALTDEAITPQEIQQIEGLLGGKTITLSPQTVAPGEGVILVDAVMPFGYKLNAAAPFTAIWAEDNVVSVAPNLRDYRAVTPALPIEFPVTLREGTTNLTVDLTIYWCEAIKETLCFVERAHVTLPVTVSAEAASSVLSLSYELTPPEVPTDTFQN